MKIHFGLPSWLKTVGLILAAVCSLGLLAYAAGQGTFTSGGFKTTGTTVHDPRNTNEQVKAYGQLIIRYEHEPKKDPYYSFSIKVNPDVLSKGIAEIEIFDSIANLAKTPRSYKIFYRGYQEKPPYANLKVSGAVKGNSTECEPKQDPIDNEPAGTLTLESFGKVDGAVTGKFNITGAWAVPANCEALGVGKSGNFSVMRAVDLDW